MLSLLCGLASKSFQFANFCIYTHFVSYYKPGTQTGRALNYTFDEALSTSRGNRPDVTDVVIVITDGGSQDDVQGISQRMRDNGVIVSLKKYFLH